MYGKHFETMYTGSMFGAGSDVFAVWGYVIAHTQQSEVELNPRYLAAVIGAPVEAMERAVAKLCEPDPGSRSKEQDGRRLIQTGQFSYRVVNHDKYRTFRNEDDRRTYNREAQRKHREQVSEDVKLCQQMSNDVKNVNDCQQMSAMSAHTEAEAYTEKTKDNATTERPVVAPRKRRRIEYPDDFQAWFRFYAKATGKGTTKAQALSEWLRLPGDDWSQMNTWTREWLFVRQTAAANGIWLPEPPDPVRFIRHRRWEDEYSQPESSSSVTDRDRAIAEGRL